MATARLAITSLGACVSFSEDTDVGDANADSNRRLGPCLTQTSEQPPTD